MNKEMFLKHLQDALSGLPKGEIEERLAFYSEMIDDKVEEGISEEEAVKEIGNIEDIVFQIVDEVPLHQLVIERVKPKRKLRVFEIVLIVLGFPIWFSLAVAAFAVVLSLYVSLWAVIICLWAVLVSFAACFVGGVAACVIFTVGGNGASGLAMLAAGIVCGGLAIFMFYGCKAATKGTLMLTKKFAVWIKNCFIKKGES